MFDVFGPGTRTPGATARQCLEMLQTYDLITGFGYDHAAEEFIVSGHDGRGGVYTPDQAANVFTEAIADMVARLVAAPDSDHMSTDINVDMKVPVVPYIAEFGDRHQVYADHWGCPLS